jgi:hypothetical protein
MPSPFSVRFIPFDRSRPPLGLSAVEGEQFLDHNR